MSTTSPPAATEMMPSAETLDDLLARLEVEWLADSEPLEISPTGAVTLEADTGPDATARVERRGARRRLFEELGDDVRLSLPGVAEARPIDISATGVLTETTSRLCPGQVIDVFLHIQGGRRVLRARVIRSCVHTVLPRPLFRAALKFEDPCRLPECDE